jgi:hypothetical protein
VTAMRMTLFAIAVMALGCSRVPAPQPTQVETPTPIPTPTIEPATPQVKPVERTPTPSSELNAKWTSLLDRIDAKAAVAGTWSRTPEGLRVGAAQGARIAIGPAPRGAYDLRIAFTRRTGSDSIGLFFPHGSGQGAFEVDAWGEHLGGIQNIFGRTLRDNETRATGIVLENGRRYTMTVEVRTERVRCLLDDHVVAYLRTTGADLSVPDLWSMPNRSHLGIGAWNSETIFHAIDLRTDTMVALAPPVVNLEPKQPLPPPPQPAPMAKSDANGKRVLLVIANRDFFYREYADPRAEMEKAGIKVTVAAGHKSACTPHSGSGEGADRGIVQPDLALKDAKAADYDAILFAGGWGSSAYQFAFPGRYDNSAYNGEKAVRRK